MYKKIFLLQIDSILGYPPTLSLIWELHNKGCKVTVLTTVINNQLIEVLPADVNVYKIGDDYTYKTPALKKFQQLFSIKKIIWKYIDEHYDEDTLLWVMSNITIKHMGMRLLKYRYNLHLFELVEKINYIGNWSFGLDLKKLAHNAHKVIVCEYNRAQITQAWLRLPELPLVISNKPMRNSFKRNNPITHSEQAKNLIERFADKKIILYQGVVDVERPIEPIAKAIEELDDSFVFLVMTGSNCGHLKKYKKTTILPYISAPYHLEVTSHAYAGILIYTPVYGIFTSPLNSIYCAPNKLYEFSQFGIPMLGNNIPGLKYTIEYYKMGCCMKDYNIESIKQAIIDIENHYKEYFANGVDFYKSDDKSFVVKQAIQKS